MLLQDTLTDALEQTEARCTAAEARAERAEAQLRAAGLAGVPPPRPLVATGVAVVEGSRRANREMLLQLASASVSGTPARTPAAANPFMAAPAPPVAAAAPPAAPAAAVAAMVAPVADVAQQLPAAPAAAVAAMVAPVADVAVVSGGSPVSVASPGSSSSSSMSYGSEGSSVTGAGSPPPLQPQLDQAPGAGEGLLDLSGGGAAGAVDVAGRRQRQGEVGGASQQRAELLYAAQRWSSSQAATVPVS